MGKKLDIFEPGVARYYDFTIKSDFYADSVPCYIFEVKKKDSASAGDVVIKTLSTWFSKEDYKVMARDYTLSYNTMLYDFNVSMSIRLSRIADKAMPTLITYKGLWDIPLNKPDNTEFEIRFSDFHF